LPHAPQFDESLDVSTQSNPQSTVPGAHDVQTPEAQNWPKGQAWPHAPQFFESFEVNVSQYPDVLLQCAKPALHVNPHVPAVHVGVANVTWEHAFPHAPQLARLVSVSTHDPPHDVCPGGHAAQTPLRQICAEGQALAHPPQFAGSCEVSTHALPQRVLPPLQSSAHAPAEHTSPGGHALPHAPQFATLEDVSVQVPPQFCVPGPHTSWHLPPAQI
jgi:hypothetical protein